MRTVGFFRPFSQFEIMTFSLQVTADIAECFSLCSMCLSRGDSSTEKPKQFSELLSINFLNKYDVLLGGLNESLCQTLSRGLNKGFCRKSVKIFLWLLGLIYTLVYIHLKFFIFILSKNNRCKLKEHLKLGDMAGFQHEMLQRSEGGID